MQGPGVTFSPPTSQGQRCEEITSRAFGPTRQRRPVALRAAERRPQSKNQTGRPNTPRGRRFRQIMRARTRWIRPLCDPRQRRHRRSCQGCLGKRASTTPDKRAPECAASWAGSSTSNQSTESSNSPGTPTNCTVWALASTRPQSRTHRHHARHAAPQRHHIIRTQTRPDMSIYSLPDKVVRALTPCGGHGFVVKQLRAA